MNPLISPSVGYIVSLLFFYKDSFGIKVTHEGWYATKTKKPKSLMENHFEESREISQGSPCSVVAKLLNFNIVVNEFELQSFPYVYFQINTLGKDMNPFRLQG